jgi:ribosome modulation factor
MVRLQLTAVFVSMVNAWIAIWDLDPVTEPVLEQFAALASIAGAAAAGSLRLDPADPRVDVPKANYRSVFSGYKGSSGPRDREPIPWSQANQRVLERGGWRAYAKETLPQNSGTDPDPTHRRD